MTQGGCRAIDRGASQIFMGAVIYLYGSGPALLSQGLNLRRLLPRNGRFERLEVLFTTHHHCSTATAIVVVVVVVVIVVIAVAIGILTAVTGGISTTTTTITASYHTKPFRQSHSECHAG